VARAVRLPLGDAALPGPTVDELGRWSVEKARAWREVQRTQIGMALHRRLGAASPMRVISADVAGLISKFL
jgi:hypothetical protein